MTAQFLVLFASALVLQTVAATSCGCEKRNPCANAAAAEFAAAEVAAAQIAGADIAAAANFGNFGYAPAYAPAPIYSAPAYAPAPIYSAPTAVYTGPAYAAKSGGAFGVSLSSPYSGTGFSVLSENSIDGALEVAGSLPVLAGVAFEGTVPSAGSAGTAYSCGSGDVGIAYESLAANGVGTERVAAKNFARAELAGAEWAARGSARSGRPSCGCY